MIRSRDTANNGIYVGSLKDPKLKKRVATAISNAACVAPLGEHPGYLLFYREGLLVAQPFDAKALQTTGEPEALSNSVGYLLNSQFANFSVSQTGTVVLGSMGTPKTQITWLDRAGNATPVAVPPDHFRSPRLSPDGSRLAIEKAIPRGGGSPWTFDFKRSLLSRVNDDGQYPAWSADGRRITYASVSAKALVRRDLESTQPPQIVAPLERDLGSGFDLSPDGKWLAYRDNTEIFVEDFPGGRTRTQVSTRAGRNPMWRRDQKEFFY